MVRIAGRGGRSVESFRLHGVGGSAVATGRGCSHAGIIEAKYDRRTLVRHDRNVNDVQRWVVQDVEYDLKDTRVDDKVLK